MGWLPVRHFCWREPQAFRQQVRRADAPTWWRNHRRASLGLAVLFPVLAASIRLWRGPGDMSWPVHLGLSAVGGLMIPWLYLFYRYLPADVRFYDRVVLRVCGDHSEGLNYADGRDFGLVDRGEYGVLVVGRASGRDLILGVPAEVDAADLADFLERRGLARLNPAEAACRLPAEWEAHPGTVAG